MSRGFQRTLFALFIAFFGYIFYTLLTAYYGNPSSPKLKRYFAAAGEFQPAYTTTVGDSAYHIIPPFEFASSHGGTISNEDVKGNLYIADFFFTSCPGICPKKTRQLTRVVDFFKNETDLRILSHTVDPDRDSIPTLQRYAKRMNADWRNWHFLHGEEKDIQYISKNGYYVSAIAPGVPKTDHTGKLILVDRKGIIRGFYEGTDSLEVNKLMFDIKVLKLEGMGPKRFKQIEYRAPEKVTHE